MRDVHVLKRLPECACVVGNNEFTQHRVEHPFTVGALKVEPVTFRTEPVSKVRAYVEEFASIGLDEILAFSVTDGDWLFAEAARQSVPASHRARHKIVRRNVCIEFYINKICILCLGPLLSVCGL